jgi:hypothetical protein
MPATVQRIIYRVVRSQLLAEATLLLSSPRQNLEDYSIALFQRVP